MFGLALALALAMANPGSAKEGLKRRVTQLGNIYVANVVFNTQNSMISARVFGENTIANTKSR
jgi:hypothetical protein